MNRKSKLEEYTEAEFTALVNELFIGPDGISEDEEEQYLIDLALYIEEITEHPEKTDLLFYPPVDREDSAKGVIQEIKAWRARSGKSGFKQPD
ncbi:hypothetical protein AO390_03600 [Pseudomonas marginalis ICMP 11289]|nr:hypothetical protein AO390_03600 [Pseudomonas marginalis ICMP 11289]